MNKPVNQEQHFLKLMMYYRNGAAKEQVLLQCNKAGDDSKQQ